MVRTDIWTTKYAKVGNSGICVLRLHGAFENSLSAIPIKDAFTPDVHKTYAKYEDKYQHLKI
jgi:hypothetical protein